MDLAKAPALAAGSRVGLIAPAGPPLDPDRLAAGIAHLEARGLQVERLRPSFGPYGYLAGTDAERLAELNGFLRRNDVQALVCVRGGYGTLRLLPWLDYEAARRHPKLLIGYSDITALHLALYHKSGWVGLQGPMAAVEWPEPDPAWEALFWSMAQGQPANPLVGPHGEALQPVRHGVAEGPLLGGTLTLLCRLLGTPYLPDLHGAILFLEEVGEEPYRIDGLLAQLRLAGVLERLGGLVLGGFTEATPQHTRPTLTLDEVLDDYTRDLHLPVARGLAFGHFPVKLTLPVGVHARLDVTPSAAHLSLLEAPVQIGNRPAQELPG
jgi:muramoyltetrapeptide carboxypeptidase